MTREAALLVMVAVAVVLLAVGLLAWRRRTARDRALTAPVGEAPAGAVTSAEHAVLYVATTRHDEPLERLAIRGLSFRSKADVVVTDHGIALDLTGQPRLFLPSTALVAVDRATVAIDRVVERDGLARLVWRIGDSVVDTYLRPQDVTTGALVAALTAALPAPTSMGTDA